MSERKKAFWVGLVGIGTMLIAGLLILWNSDFTGGPFGGETYQLQLVVPQAPGVAPDTPVRRRGILIGRVAKVEATDDGALITVNVEEGKEVKTNESPRVQTSMMGDAIVEFVPIRPPEGAQPVQPGATIKGSFNPNPVDLLADMQGDLRTTIQSLGRAGDEVAELADRLNAVMGGQDMERLTNLVENMETAMDRFGRVMGNVDDIIGDEQLKENIRQGIAQLPTMIADARAIFQALEEAASSADQNLKNLQGFTRPLGERGDKIVGIMEDSVGNLEELLANAAIFVKNFNNSEGTIGRLLNDRTLSDEAEITIRNANQAISQLREVIANVDVMMNRFRPIIDDVRIFTDKIARDPARIARGVVNRETPLGNDVNSFRRGPFKMER